MAKPAKKSESDADPSDVLSFRGVPRYLDWVRAFAKGQETTVCGLLEAALLAYAEAKGFMAPPKRGSSRRVLRRPKGAILNDLLRDLAKAEGRYYEEF